MRSSLDGIKGVTHTFEHSLLFVFVCTAASAIGFLVSKKYGAVVCNTVAGAGIALAVLLIGVVRLMDLRLFGSDVDLVVGGLIFLGIFMVAAGLAAFGVATHQNNEKAS